MEHREHSYRVEGLDGIVRIDLDSTDSTNTFLKKHCSEPPPPMTIVTADFQSSGRGSGGNTWESARGENLLFSLLVYPQELKAGEMFTLSEVLSLAVCHALNQYVSGFSIKWPNDIYFENRKVVGMLIENDLMGKYIHRSVMGVGVNVNQQQFLSDAPNPCSLAQILGHRVDREEVLQRIIQCFGTYYDRLKQGAYPELHAVYLSQIFRWGEWHWYRDEKGRFRASIVGILPTGNLILQDECGLKRRYAFKEVQYEI